MYIVEPKVEILAMRSRDEILKNIEKVGRTAYKSEDKITEDSAPKFVKMLVNRGHMAVLEHESITVKFTTNRGVSHEIVRHRVASFCQESTRYCNYGKANEIVICRPSYMKGVIDCGPYFCINRAVYNGYNTGNSIKVQDLSTAFVEQFLAWEQSEKSYLNMLANGCTPQQARGVLPNDVKTEIVMTANLREWQHFLNLRSHGTTGAPHPDMKEVADMLYEQLVQILPEVFEV